MPSCIIRLSLSHFTLATLTSRVTSFFLCNYLTVVLCNRMIVNRLVVGRFLKDTSV